jgi:hypothetical protein
MGMENVLMENVFVIHILKEPCVIKVIIKLLFRKMYK